MAREELLAEAGGDPAVLRRMIELFGEHTFEVLDQMRAAVRRGDTAQLGWHAHTLKGSASLFGAHRAYRLAQEVEAAARSENLSEGARKLDEFKAEMVLVGESLKRLLKEL